MNKPKIVQEIQEAALKAGGMLRNFPRKSLLPLKGFEWLEEFAKYTLRLEAEISRLRHCAEETAEEADISRRNSREAFQKPSENPPGPVTAGILNALGDYSIIGTTIQPAWYASRGVSGNRLWIEMWSGKPFSSDELAEDYPDIMILIDTTKNRKQP